MSSNSPVIRIPNLPTGQIVNSDGFATDDELNFRQVLVTSLQDNFGAEGCVLPTQNYAELITIQNHQNVSGQYTCAFGTGLYCPDFPIAAVPTPSIVFCVPDGSGNPLFRAVVLV